MMMYYIYYNIAAGDAYISETPGGGAHYNFFGEYETREKAEEALDELAGPTIWVVFVDYARGDGYVSPENNLSGHWRGSRDYPYAYAGEYETEAEAEKALAELLK